MARTFQVTFDAADPDGLCRFWCAALGYEMDAPPAGFDSWEAALESWGIPPERRNDASACHDPDGVGPRLFFQKVPESKQGKNRVHLDIRAAVGVNDEDRLEAFEVEAERLVALGATRLQRHEKDAINAGNIVMADPEGNEFCLD